MPEDDERKKQSELALGDSAVAEPAAPPPVIPPATRTPFQINQQINIQQLPPKALEKLSADQLFELSKTAIAQFERTDERQFKLAMEQITSSTKSHRIGTYVGGVLALCGFSAVTYLTIQGHQVVAAIIGTFLATVISITIGNRMLQ